MVDIDVGYIRGGLLGGKYTDNTFIIRNGLMRKAENPKKNRGLSYKIIK